MTTWQLISHSWHCSPRRFRQEWKHRLIHGTQAELADGNKYTGARKADGDGLLLPVPSELAALRTSIERLSGTSENLPPPPPKWVGFVGSLFLSNFVQELRQRKSSALCWLSLGSSTCINGIGTFRPSPPSANAHALSTFRFIYCGARLKGWMGGLVEKESGNLLASTVGSQGCHGGVYSLACLLACLPACLPATFPILRPLC